MEPHSTGWCGTPVEKGTDCREVLRDSARPMDSGRGVCPSASGTVHAECGILFEYQLDKTGCTFMIVLHTLATDFK